LGVIRGIHHRTIGVGIDQLPLLLLGRTRRK